VEEAWGSGVLVTGGYIVTNAHVVWPGGTVRVSFGREDEIKVPVLGWDLLADIAVLGPVAVDLPSFSFGDQPTILVGDSVTLSGFVDEELVSSQGTVRLIREWHGPRIQYLETDAPIVGGQSGGALLNDADEIIGILGWSYSGEAFAASAQDIERIVGRILEGDSPPGEVSLQQFSGRPETDLVVELSTVWDRAGLLLDVPESDILDLQGMLDLHI